MILARQQLAEKLQTEEPICFKGKEIEFQDEGTGMITNETEDSIYITSKFFTGWMFKTEYFDLLGVED
jgi:hypothetical protein